ncbi:MmpS family transport accessory protein [Streptomyces sp. NPDC046324]|uniref:MmpS family transport accessory protein n=1 Tax=Streptomyces sp. NPDC046324 TaxID=3154915 RepID=UPI0033DDDFC1
MASTEESPNPEVPDRTGIAVAAALLLGCAALVAYGFAGGGEDRAPRRAATETVGVTYEVLGEGTADITYRGGGDGDRAESVRGARLPWRKTVDVPRGAAPLVNITLGERGGSASCALTVDGRHVQRATASGAFGRSTCTGAAPAGK